MKFFLDTGNVDEIKEANELGLVDGVTTNPSLIAKTGRSQEEVVKEICSIVDGPISAEVVSTDVEGMIKEAKKLAGWHKNVVVKLPMTLNGLKALNYCTKNKIKTNVTLVFSANQALLAGKGGATYVSPFIGRLDDNGQDGMHLIQDILEIYNNYGFETQVLAASIRHPMHVYYAAKMGAHVATMPLKVIMQLAKHPLTDIGLEKFLADYKASQK